MNVLFAIFEMSPLAKVGGLGDVAGSLPRALRAHGADVRVALPLHGVINRDRLALERVAADVGVPWRGAMERVALWRADVRGVPVYLIEHGRYFDRPEVYRYDDDAERMLFYCDALKACAPHLGFAPDVVHTHDWHAALLLTRLAGDPSHPWASCGRVYTIHNLGITGAFDDAFAAEAGIDGPLLRAPAGLDGAIVRSGMAQGIIHTDYVNTVSETYAREILTPEYGAGLDPLLRARAGVLCGIVNGIDYEEFDPATDPALPRNYDVDSIGVRLENKRVLQSIAGLARRDDVPLFGVVTRLFAQKGIDLAAIAFDSLLAVRDIQLCVLGTGDEEVHSMLSRLEEKYRDNVKVWLEFNAPLGQQIYGGCDVFLMPSRYEPCGLGQLISLRYGAVPLVRRTGGLADTVQNADLPLRSGTGFVFDAANAHELEDACERALASFENHEGWRALQVRGMKQDWSWSRAAGKYIELYEKARGAARARSGAK